MMLVPFAIIAKLMARKVWDLEEGTVMLPLSALGLMRKILIGFSNNFRVYRSAIIPMVRMGVSNRV